jgi:Leucine-rich repeat (LRR) protein
MLALLIAALLLSVICGSLVGILAARADLPHLITIGILVLMAGITALFGIVGASIGGPQGMLLALGFARVTEDAGEEVLLLTDAAVPDCLAQMPALQSFVADDNALLTLPDLTDLHDLLYFSASDNQLTELPPMPRRISCMMR